MWDKAMNCFEFKNVSFSYFNGRVILENQTFSIPKEVFVLIGGPSGSGKSSLLRLMNGLEQAQSGVIYCENKSLDQWNPPDLRRKVVYLQQLPVVPDLSVRQNLLLPFSFESNKKIQEPKDEELKAGLENVLLKNVGLDEKAATLSGGQKQRLCLLRALMPKPLVLLLDEPTASLDKKSKAIIENMLEDLCAKGVTIIMVTHDAFKPKKSPIVDLEIKEGGVTICR